MPLDACNFANFWFVPREQRVTLTLSLQQTNFIELLTYISYAYAYQISECSSMRGKCQPQASRVTDQFRVLVGTYRCSFLPMHRQFIFIIIFY